MLINKTPVEPAPISWWKLIEKQPTSGTVVLQGEPIINGPVIYTLKGRHRSVVGSLLLLAAAYVFYRQAEQAPVASEWPGAAVELFLAARTPDVENATGCH